MFEPRRIAERLRQHADIYAIAAQLYHDDERLADDFERLAYECRQIARRINRALSMEDLH